MRLSIIIPFVVLGLGLANALAIPGSSANSRSAVELFNRAAPACKIGDKGCGAGGCPGMKSTLKQSCKPARKKRPGKVGRALDMADELWDRATNGGKKTKQCPTDKTKTPTTKKPTTKKPTTKKPTTKKPTTKKPTTKKPTTKKPTTKKPTTKKPTTKKPTTKKPTTKKPTTKKPTTKKPTTKKPTTKKPTTKKPTTKKPTTKKPTTKKPTTKKPTTKKPTTKKPTTKKPTTRRPSKVRPRPVHTKKPKACRGRRCRREDDNELRAPLTFSHVTDNRDVANDGVEKLNEFSEGTSDEFEGVSRLLKRAGAFIEKRMPRGVKMDEGKGRKWAEGQTMSTEAISYCSVLVVYSDVEIAMAHIPPGRIENGIYNPGEVVTAEHLRKLDGEFSFFNGGAKAIFYYHQDLDPDRVQQVKTWLTEKGIAASERDVVSHVGGFEGSGKLQVYHRGKGHKAQVSFG